MASTPSTDKTLERASGTAHEAVDRVTQTASAHTATAREHHHAGSVGRPCHVARVRADLLPRGPT